MKHAYDNGKLIYGEVVAIGQNTCAHDVNNPVWHETRTFSMGATIEEVMRRAYAKSITGNLILTVNEGSMIFNFKKGEENEKTIREF
jgi:hypothetical protein